MGYHKVNIITALVVFSFFVNCVLFLMLDLLLLGDDEPTDLGTPMKKSITIL